MIEEVLRILESASVSEVSLGYNAIVLFDANEFEKAQLGYRSGVSGEDLTGSKKGDWLDSWYVIGEDEFLGDPIFVDINQVQFSVYTAVHGVGFWEPEQLAISLENFLVILKELTRLSKQRETPNAFRDHPLTDEESERLLDTIEKANPGISMDYWESWLEIE